MLEYSEGMCPAVRPFMGIPQRQTSRGSPACIYQLPEEEVEKPLTVIFFQKMYNGKPQQDAFYCVSVCVNVEGVKSV